MTIKDMFREGYNRIADALDRCGADRETVGTIIGVYQKVCHEYALCNATACVFEGRVMDADKELWTMAVNPARNHDAIMMRYDDTIPEEWLEMDD